MNGRVAVVNEAQGLVQFPVPGQTTLIVLAVLFFGLFLTAVAIEFYRRKEAARKRATAEWGAVAGILKERGLPEDEKASLTAMLERHAPMTPLKAVTSRQEFDRCVDAEMRALLARGDTAQFERTGKRIRAARERLALDYVPLGQSIQSTRELHAGQWLSAAAENEPAPHWYRMIIEDVDEAYLWLGRRAKEGEPAPPFRAGDRIRCRLWRDEDGRYSFVGTVSGYDGPPPIWRLLHTRELHRVQTRDHYRVRFDQPTTVELISAPADGNLDGVRERRALTRLRGRITSLSAGGCALVLHQPVSKHVLLRVPIEIADNQTVEAEARVVAQSPISGERSLVRAEFVGLDEERRDKIAKYVIQRQQHMLAAKEAAS